MTFVPHSRILPRNLWRPAIFFFAVAQVLLSFAPLLEGRQGPDAQSHVEALGTTLHHAHNDADCAACAVRGLLSSADPEPVSSYDFSRETGGITEREAPSPHSALLLFSRSRAPPSTL